MYLAAFLLLYFFFRMPLSWTEIRKNAYDFALNAKDYSSEQGEAQTFWNDFFEVFGISRRKVAVFEKNVRKHDPTLPAGLVEEPTPNKQGRIDLFWPGVLIGETKSLGKNLDDAYQQALEYVGGLEAHDKPQYIFVADFARLRLYDLRKGTVFPTAADHTEILVADLGKHVRLFGFMAGYQQRTYQEQDPVNVQAAERMGRLHDQLEASGYRGSDLERYLVRLLFCLFAEDTDIFPRAAFMDLVSQHAGPKGQQLGPLLHQLFETLDTPEDQRPATLPEHLREFPYVNGDLFRGPLRTVSFDSQMRDLLLDATRLDWGQISPAIFGSLFQSVMDPTERRTLGAHYTSEQNIRKALGPLLLDELRAELNHLSSLSPTSRAPRLRDLQARLAKLRLLDPACGCGNFLVVAYRELRLLELDVLALLYPNEAGTQQGLGVATLVQLQVDQMHGIEIDEFAARIAEVALWLVDHQMNQLLSVRFGQYYARLPLRHRARILHANALTTDWNTVLPNTEATHIVGNPPFVGAMVMSPQQRKELLNVFQHQKGVGVLDYVAAWYWKAAEYIQGTEIPVALVSTNSITQGEQVSLLWSPLLNRFGIKIHFAHQTFKWTNEARGKAAVHCIILGFGTQEIKQKRLFTYDTVTSEPQEQQATILNPYLVEGPIVLLPNRSVPLGFTPPIRFGSMPRDGGHFILNVDERNELLTSHPEIAPWVRSYVGAYEFINNQARYCLWLVDIPVQLLRRVGPVLKRVEAVRQFRAESKAAATRRFAEIPTLFCQIAQPKTDYLLIPSVSSERRQYMPIGFMSPDTIASNLVFTVPNATLYHFGVLTSAMHMAWMRYTCGRLKSDYRYSKDIVYNNFPWPVEPGPTERQALEAAAQAVLDARAAHPGSTLADLYDPLAMPADLRAAHRHLDRLVDRLYRRKPFKHDTERMQRLFEKYAELSAPLAPAAAPVPRGRTRRAGTP